MIPDMGGLHLDGTTLWQQTTTSEALPNPVTPPGDRQGLRPLSQTERISAADASQQEFDSRFFAVVTPHTWAAPTGSARTLPRQ